MTKTKPFICYNATYMSYGYISAYSMCTQPPMCCKHEMGETVILKTGVKVKIYYCTKDKNEISKMVPTKPKGLYVGLVRAESIPIELNDEPPSSCSLSGHR